MYLLHCHGELWTCHNSERRYCPVCSIVYVAIHFLLIICKSRALPYALCDFIKSKVIGFFLYIASADLKELISIALNGSLRFIKDQH